jgi:hypothetical protein
MVSKVTTWLLDYLIVEPKSPCCLCTQCYHFNKYCTMHDVKIGSHEGSPKMSSPCRKHTCHCQKTSHWLQLCPGPELCACSFALRSDRDHTYKPKTTANPARWRNNLSHVVSRLCYLQHSKPLSSDTDDVSMLLASFLLMGWVWQCIHPRTLSRNLLW